MLQFVKVHEVYASCIKFYFSFSTSCTFEGLLFLFLFVIIFEVPPFLPTTRKLSFCDIKIMPLTIIYMSQKLIYDIFCVTINHVTKYSKFSCCVWIHKTLCATQKNCNIKCTTYYVSLFLSDTYQFTTLIEVIYPYLHH